MTMTSHTVSADVTEQSICLHPLNSKPDNGGDERNERGGVLERKSVINCVMNGVS